MTLEILLLLLGLIAEATVLGLLLHRRIYKQLPLFSAYLAWSVINDIGLQFLLQRYAGVAVRIYLVSAIIDAVFVFCVLSEISMSVLKPVRASLPRWTLFAVAGLIAFVCAVVWPFAKPSDFHQGPTFQLVLHMQLTTALVRVLFFLALAALSQLLSLGWRDRELQIATGFGIYSLASLLAALLPRSLPGGWTQFHHLDELVSRKLHLRDDVLDGEFCAESAGETRIYSADAEFPVRACRQRPEHADGDDQSSASQV